MPIGEFCHRNGASAAFVRMVAFGHDLSGMSTLQLLRDVALAATTRQWFKIRGGNDRLPAGLAAMLSDRIRYGAAVTRIQQDDRSVRVTYLRGREPVTLEGDYVICTMPAPLMAAVRVSPALPPATRSAFAELGSLPMARVHIQTDRRFWLDRGETGWAGTDDPMDVWDYSRDQAGQRGILGAYLSGRIAKTVTRMAPDRRGVFILERMEHVHPGTKAHYETSPWSGWMNGGLESGHRVASALIERER